MVFLRFDQASQLQIGIIKTSVLAEIQKDLADIVSTTYVNKDLNKAYDGLWIVKRDLQFVSTFKFLDV